MVATLNFQNNLQAIKHQVYLTLVSKLFIYFTTKMFQLEFN